MSVVDIVCVKLAVYVEYIQHIVKQSVITVSELLHHGPEFPIGLPLKERTQTLQILGLIAVALCTLDVFEDMAL